MAMSSWSAIGTLSGHVGIGGCHQMHRGTVYMAYGIGAGSHRRCSCGVDNRILPHSSWATGGAAGALSTVSRSRGRSRGHVELLLMAQQQVPASETSRAFRTLKWLLLGVRSLMTLEMFQSRETSLASAADMRSRFVVLWRGEVGRCFAVAVGCRRRYHHQSV